MANELGWAQHGNPAFSALACDHMMQHQRGRRCKLLGKSYQSRWASCLSVAVPRVRYALSESRFLGVERLHLKLNICLRPVTNEYYEWKMQRTLKRELKVLKLLEGEWVGPVLLGEIGAWRWHSCQCLRCCLPCLSEPVQLWIKLCA